MPFIQAAFVYTVQLAIGCVHKPFKFFFIMPHINVSMFLMCVNKLKVLPHHLKFSSYALYSDQLRSNSSQPSELRE